MILRWRSALPVLLTLLVLILLVLHWGASNRVMWEYLLRPFTIPVQALNLPGGPTLASPCETLQVDLVSLTLTGTGIRIRGQVEQHCVDYLPHALDLALTGDLERPDRGSRTKIVSPLTWVHEDGARWAEWHFSHRDTGIRPGDTFQLHMHGFRLAKELDVREEVPLHRLMTAPAAVAAGEEGHLRIERIDLDPEDARIVVTHVPGDKMTRMVSGGACFQLLMGPITDGAGNRYGPVSGSGTKKPGEPWSHDLTLLPIDSERVGALVFTLYRAEIFWHTYDAEDAAHVRIVLPRRIL